MAIPSRQIGWSGKSNLLWEISKQLERLTQVMGNIEVEPVGPTTSTTSTTTTVAPGPTPSYSGTINVSTLTPGNEYFNFRVLSTDNGEFLSFTVNWGDETSQAYNNISPDAVIYANHTYPSNGEWVVTITSENPAQINTLDLDRNNNESPAEVTGFDFRNFNGMNQLIFSNNDALHVASTVGLSTLTILLGANADLESLSLLDGDNITNLSANNNNLSVLDLTTAVSLEYVNLADNQLVAIDITDCPNINYLELSNNALTESNVDEILVTLANNNVNNGYANLVGSANDAPSQTGLDAKTTLEGRGWTVTVSTSSGINTKLLYFKGVSSLNAKNTLFLNNYYFNNDTNLYSRWNIREVPKTVYYVGTFGINTTLYTNSELTEFIIPDGTNWSYQLGVIVDATINPNNVSGDLTIYQFSGGNGVILDNLGIVADHTYTVQSVLKASNASTYCDAENGWYNQYAYYPPGQNGAVVGGYAHSEIALDWGQPGNNQLTPAFKLGNTGTTVFLFDNSNTGLITGSNPCTYIPTWNASWGTTAQEAIDGTNPIAIKPVNGNSMLTTITIKQADNTPFYEFPNLFYVAYDGVVRAFYNGYYASWNQSYPLQPVTPPVTPYSFQILDTSSCALFNNPSSDPNKITAYSNFNIIGIGTPIYTDAALTIPLNIYTYYTNGLGYFNCYDYQWTVNFNPCYD